MAKVNRWVLLALTGMAAVGLVSCGQLAGDPAAGGDALAPSPRPGPVSPAAAPAPSPAGRVVLCHVPEGNPANSTTISVGPAAVPGHLAHGDSLGPCGSPPAGFCAGLPDGVECDDGKSCTVGDVCRSGVCAGVGPGTVIGPGTTTLTCPLELQAVDGLFVPQCSFPDVLAPNAFITGTGYLQSHLDRSWAGYDINDMGGGQIQLMCIYSDAAGTQIGGISATVTAPGGCTAEAVAFTCTN